MGVEVVVVVVVVVEGAVPVVVEVVVVEDDVRIVGLVTPETVVPVREGSVMLVAVVDEEADGFQHDDDLTEKSGIGTKFSSVDHTGFTPITDYFIDEER